ncbi:NlpC/P60 family protein, partial [Acinetobacter baumannii]
QFATDSVMEAKQKAIQESFRYIGTPYKWGGQSLTGGIDCSAFVQTLYGKEGIALPRTAREQALVGQKVERLEQLQPGDRLYFWS